MQSLVESLEHSRTCVRWFAMGEAMRIDESIRLVLEEYQKKQTKANRKRVLEIAIITAKFLSSQGSKESRTIGRELSNQIFRLKLEGSI